MGAKRRKLRRQAKRGSISAAEELGWRVVEVTPEESAEKPKTKKKAKKKAD
jgi:hypothetical protein